MITQGSKLTLPKSVAMSGSAAAIPRAWKDASAALAKTAVDAGSSWRERTLLGSGTGAIYEGRWANSAREVRSAGNSSYERGQLSSGDELVETEVVVTGRALRDLADTLARQMRDLSPRQTSSALLMTAFALHLGGVVIFNGRELAGWFADTNALYTWERSLFIAAFAAAALGVDLLGSRLRDAGRVVLGRLSATAFLIAAILGIVVEASFLSSDGSQTPFVVVMVVALFLAEAIMGWSLIGSQLVSDWIAWLLIVWNVGWLAGFIVTSTEDLYYPILHFVPLLFVAIGFLRRPRVVTATVS